MKIRRRKTTYISSGKRWKSTALVCFILFFAVFVFCGCDLHFNKDGEWRPTVTVMLEDADGVTVTSQNPIKIPIGSDASFDIELDESLVIDSMTDGAVIENGKLTIRSVLFPVTLKLETHRRVKCNFSVSTKESDMGSIESSHKNGIHWSESEVSITATPKEGFVFAGFSIGKPLNDGGMITQADRTYSFELSEDVDIYANFAKEWVDPATQVDVPADKWVLLYHSNGGVLSDTGTEGIKTVQSSNLYYLCPNTIPDRDFFERDGYILYGYNTEPDGSGTYYGTGWNVIMPERGAISLYCMWAKVSDIADFKYTVDSKGNVTLNTYTGNDEFVVIPETIDGRPVTTLSSRTFKNNSSVKKVLINKNIRTIHSSAFIRCSALEEMYFTDAVTTVNDEIMTDCNNFKKIYMLAYVSPQYTSTRTGTYAIKYERLITASGPKLVIASGSNVAYGVDSPLLEELLQNDGHKYSVVNYGQNAANALTFYIEVISAHTNEGDLIVLAPEINKFQFGYSEINTTLWQIFEGAYNAFSEVDMRYYTKFFSSFATFNNTRNQRIYNPRAYETHTNDTVNSYGDYSLYKEGYTEEYGNTVKSLLDNGGVGGWTYNSNVTSIKNHSDSLNRTLDMIKKKGGIPLFSFAATNKLALNSGAQIAGGETQSAFESAVDTYIHATRISSVSTYTMDSEWFYNSHNHLGTAGAKERTKNLAADILAYLADNA